MMVCVRPDTIHMDKKKKACLQLESNLYPT